MKMLGVYSVELRPMAEAELAKKFSFVDPQIRLASFLQRISGEQTVNVGVVEFDRDMNRQETVEEASRHGYQLATGACFVMFAAQHPNWEKTYLIESWIRVADARGVANPYLSKWADRPLPELRLGLEGRNGPTWRYLVVPQQEDVSVQTNLQLR